MADTIALDPPTVSYIADKLVRAHQDLQSTPDPAVGGGVYNATTANFCDWVEKVMTVHTENRYAIVGQLANLSQQLRAAASHFQGLEEEYRSALFALESAAYTLAQPTQASDSSPTSVGSAPAGSGAVPEQGGL